MIMINSHKSGANEKLTGKRKPQWIIDTGASHHMTGNITHLSRTHDVTPCLVGLPNGENATVVKEDVCI